MESQEEMVARIKRDAHIRRELYIEMLNERHIYPDIPLPETPWFTVNELRGFGFTSVGKNVKVSRKCSLYFMQGWLGDHVRIDDYCTLKGDVVIGSYVHIANYVMISAMSGRVTFRPFSSAAARSTILTTTDDHRANTLSNSCVPKQYLTSITGPITVGIGTLVGTHCVVLPNVTIGDGASIGSGCVVYRDVPDGGVLRMPRPELLDRKRDYRAILAMANKVLKQDAESA
jgi:galactoside O-acetyltransferase